MKSSDRDLSRALAGALVLAAVVLLVVVLKLPGFFLSVALIAAVVMIGRRYQLSPEVESMQASLRLARDDIAEILASFDDLQHGASAAAVADRTLHFPALANPDMSVPAINEFLLRASSARRFIARVDSYLDSPVVDRPQLERLISVADQRAFELQVAWDEARRAAREIGPS